MSEGKFQSKPSWGNFPVTPVTPLPPKYGGRPQTNGVSPNAQMQTVNTLPVAQTTSIAQKQMVI
jgi:hypothetical protein